MIITTVAQVLAWLSAALILFVTIAPIRMRPSTITKVHIDRSTAFAVMAFLFVLAFPRCRLEVAAACIVGSGLSEFMQRLVPSRHAEANHAFAKAAGAAIGSVIAFVTIIALKLV
jgi:VanZ family protein